MDAFFVKSDYSVPGDVHSAYNYTHFVSVWQHFANYFDNSYRSYIPSLLNFVDRRSELVILGKIF